MSHRTLSYALCLQLVAEFSKGRVPKEIRTPGDPRCLTWSHSDPKEYGAELPGLFDTSGLKGFDEFFTKSKTFK